MEKENAKLTLVFFSLLQNCTDNVDVPSGKKALCHRNIRRAFSFLVVHKVMVFLTMGGFLDWLKSTMCKEGGKWLVFI